MRSGEARVSTARLTQCSSHIRYFGGSRDQNDMGLPNRTAYVVRTQPHDKDDA